MEYCKKAEDGASEEYILELPPPPLPPIEIVRTTAVTVDYDRSRSGGRDEREMHQATVLPRQW